MPASLFNGDAVKILKNKLRFKKGVDIECDANDNIAIENDFVPFKGTAKEFDLGDEVFEGLSTGISSFAGLSINASTTTYDVGAATGHIVDLAGGNYYSINFAGQTNITPLGVITYVLIDNTGAISAQTTEPTPDDRRNKIFLGRVITIGGTVTTVLDTPVVYSQTSNQVYDLADSIGLFNIEGNEISPNGANLSFDKSAGKLFSSGANYINDADDPHRVTTPAGSPFTFAYITQASGSTGSDTTLVVPGSYDNAGTITAIGGSNNQATIQRVYLFPSGAVRVAYGQNIYSNISEALQNVSSEGFTDNPNVGGGVLIGFIVVRKGATDLSDENDAVFLKASRFGEASVGSSGLSTSTMQNTYDNSSQPQITVNTTQGGVQVRDAATPIGDSLFEIQDNGGTTNYLTVDATEVAVNQIAFQGNTTPKIQISGTDLIGVDGTGSFNLRQSSLPVVAAGASSNNGQTIADGGVIIYEDEIYDTNTAYDTTTGVFTVPTGEGGYYRVSASIRRNAVGQVRIVIQKNSSNYARFYNSDSAIDSTVSGSCSMSLAAGDTVRVIQDLGSSITIRGTAEDNTFFIEKIN